MRVGFVGAGRLAQALAPALDRLVQDTAVVAVTARSAASAQGLAGRLHSAQAVGTVQAVADTSDLIIIATPDDVIASVASAIQWKQGQMAVHCSGAQSATLLAAAAEQGAITGVFHPLQTFVGGQERDAGTFKDITFSVEAP